MRNHRPRRHVDIFTVDPHSGQATSMVEFCLPLITDYSNPTIISPESSIRWVRPPLKNQLTGGSRILLYPVNTLLSDCGFFLRSSPAVEENLDPG